MYRFEFKVKIISFVLWTTTISIYNEFGILTKKYVGVKVP